MKGILKTVAITASAIMVFWTAFFFRKEIIDWADKPADNASVTLIVVVVCYLFSLPINHKLNKIVNFIHGFDYEHESEDE